MLTVLLIISTLITKAAADCYNGKKNGETWNLKCRSCICNRNKILCSYTCNREAVVVNRLVETTKQRKSNLHAIKRIDLYSGGCQHDTKRRKNNETWHEVGHHTSSADVNKECMMCQCHRKIVSCTIRICPAVTCKKPIRKNGSCCLVCPAQIKNQRIENGVCKESGSIFQEPATWQVYIPKSNHCILCKCEKDQNRKVQHSCLQYRCPQSKCKKSNSPQQCCLSCKDHLIPVTGATPLYFKTGPAKKTTSTPQITFKRRRNKKDCIFADQVYKHGERFTPKLGNCLRCTCKKAVAKCVKVKCPVSYHCKVAEERPGLCCKVCPGISDTYARLLEERYETRNVTKDAAKDCRSTKGGRIKVYEYQPEGEDASILRISFLFDRSPMEKLEMHIWTVQNGKTTVAVSKISSNTITSRWKLLGTIKERFMNRFYQKEKELKSTIGISDFIKKMRSISDLLKAKASKKHGKKRSCKSTVMTNSSIIVLEEVLKSLKEVGEVNQR